MSVRVGGGLLSWGFHHREGWSLTPESLEGHRLICILAQRHPLGNPELRWDRVEERLAAFWRSSPPVQGERESSAASIGSAGEKKDKTEVKTLVRWCLRRQNGGSGKKSQCLKLDIKDRLEV